MSTENSEIGEFISLLYQLSNDPEAIGIIEWTPAGDELVVKDEAKFTTYLLQRYFRASTFASFVRQLNLYGFSKRGDRFYHPHFRRDCPDDLRLIKRKLQATLSATSAVKKVNGPPTSLYAHKPKAAPKKPRVFKKGIRRSSRNLQNGEDDDGHDTNDDINEGETTFLPSYQNDFVDQDQTNHPVADQTNNPNLPKQQRNKFQKSQKARQHQDYQQYRRDQHHQGKSSYKYSQQNFTPTEPVSQNFYPHYNNNNNNEHLFNPSQNQNIYPTQSTFSPSITTPSSTLLQPALYSTPSQQQTLYPNFEASLDPTLPLQSSPPTLPLFPPDHTLSSQQALSFSTSPSTFHSNSNHPHASTSHIHSTNSFDPSQTNAQYSDVSTQIVPLAFDNFSSQPYQRTHSRQIPLEAGQTVPIERYNSIVSELEDQVDVLTQQYSVLYHTQHHILFLLSRYFGSDMNHPIDISNIFANGDTQGFSDMNPAPIHNNNNNNNTTSTNQNPSTPFIPPNTDTTTPNTPNKPINTASTDLGKQTNPQNSSNPEPDTPPMLSIVPLSGIRISVETPQSTPGLYQQSSNPAGHSGNSSDLHIIHPGQATPPVLSPTMNSFSPLFNSTQIPPSQLNSNQHRNNHNNTSSNTNPNTNVPPSPQQDRSARK